MVVVSFPYSEICWDKYYRHQEGVGIFDQTWQKSELKEAISKKLQSKYPQTVARVMQFHGWTKYYFVSKNYTNEMMIF